MKNICIKCGLEATHHHKYCDKCYPQKSATILQLKDEIKELKKQLNHLKHSKMAMRREYREQIRKIKQSSVSKVGEVNLSRR
jgi:predicted amidophosphoribosyltransferase